jgi:hypothetical protein
MTKNEIKISPDCPFKNQLNRKPARSRSRIWNEKLVTRTAGELRAKSTLAPHFWGVKCIYFIAVLERIQYYVPLLLRGYFNVRRKSALPKDSVFNLYTGKKNTENRTCVYWKYLILNWVSIKGAKPMQLAYNFKQIFKIICTMILLKILI